MGFCEDGGRGEVDSVEPVLRVMGGQVAGCLVSFEDGTGEDGGDMRHCEWAVVGGSG